MTQAAEYRRNHYVPQWYQKRFLPPKQIDQELFYLDLAPKSFVDPRGASHLPRNPRKLGFRFCFADKDLYTTSVSNIGATEIERRFFGAIDREGQKAVDYFATFAHPSNAKPWLERLTTFMSTQKLRTPKGLAWLSESAGTNQRDHVLRLMLQHQQLYSAIWAECVWLIADASKSKTKFIVSDHPVTVYNRRCGPRSIWCRGNNDPDIRYHGTHTLFPLSLERILILTNLSWVRNPYQKETDSRPNPTFYHEALMNFFDIQTLRHLTEPEVREINFIIKSRARRYIAAGREEWLYPETFVTKADWRNYGDGYLLMPDPRAIKYGTQTIIQFKDGTSKTLDEYGRQPGQDGYSGDRKTVGDDWHLFQRFQGEFATLFGPYRRGRAFQMMHLDNERDSDEYHQYHISLVNKTRGH